MPCHYWQCRPKVNKNSCYGHPYYLFPLYYDSHSYSTLGPFPFLLSFLWSQWYQELLLFPSVIHLLIYLPPSSLGSNTYCIPISFTLCYLSLLQSYGPCASQTIDRTFMTWLPLWSYWTSYLPELVDTISNTVWSVYYSLACHWESTLPFSTLLLDSALPLAFDRSLNKPRCHLHQPQPRLL